jgi:heterogeneous nuclear ribonucleoprotein L
MSSIQHFGEISHIIRLSKKRQALVEFEDIAAAVALVEYCQSNPVYVGGRQAQFNYSTSQKLERQGGPEAPNTVLLFTVLNPQYPITVDVMHTITSQHGTVNRIVIFKKNGVQAMVEFESIADATSAKNGLQGADIYSGCCTLQIQFAKPPRLNVFKNDQDSWDYTNPHLGKDPQAAPAKAALLDTPRYGGGPGGYHDGPGGPPPPRGGQSAYGGMDAYGGGYGSPAAGGYDAGYGRQEPPSRYGPPEDHRYAPEPMPYGRGPPPPPGAPGPYGAAPDYQDNGVPGAGMGLQGAVMMVYGLGESMNCERVFNLFCLYGNVVRVKFLRSKEGSAMVQMGDPGAVERCMKNLNGAYFFGSKLQLGYSKQAFLQDVPNPHDLKDGSPSFKDFMGNRNNRFTNPEAAAKNRIQPPTKCLYYFNAPAKIEEEELKNVFVDAGCVPPSKVKQFPTKSEKSSTGLVEWENKNEAIEAICNANHAEIPNPGGKYPYTLKLVFNASEIGGGGQRRGPPQNNYEQSQY